MNDIDGVIKGPKSPTTEPRCHSDQVDPLVDNLPYVLEMGFECDFIPQKYLD